MIDNANFECHDFLTPKSSSQFLPKTAPSAVSSKNAAHVCKNFNLN